MPLPHDILGRTRALVAPLALFAALGGDAQAQQAPRRDFESGMRTGVGYSMVMPDVMAGVGAWHLFGTGRLGAFLDAKMSYPDLTKDEEYCPASISPCTAANVRATRPEIWLRDQDQFLIFNGGLVINAAPEMSFLVGAGHVRRARYTEFASIALDPDEFITDSGAYWAPEDPRTVTEIQAVVGVLMRLGSRIVLRFGYETAPGGLSGGGYLVLPF